MLPLLCAPQPWLSPLFPGRLQLVEGTLRSGAFSAPLAVFFFRARLLDPRRPFSFPPSPLSHTLRLGSPRVGAHLTRAMASSYHDSLARSACATVAAFAMSDNAVGGRLECATTSRSGFVATPCRRGSLLVSDGWPRRVSDGHLWCPNRFWRTYQARTTPRPVDRLHRLPGWFLTRNPSTARCRGLDSTTSRPRHATTTVRPVPSRSRRRFVRICTSQAERPESSERTRTEEA